MRPDAAAAISALLLVPLLLLFAACEFIEQNPPPNIPATVIAEGSTVAAEAATVVAEGSTVAAEAAADAKQAVATVVALVTPQPQPTSTRAVPTPTPPPTPTPLPPTPTPTEDPPPTVAPVTVGEDHNETIVTSLGQQVDVTVTGFHQNHMQSDQLVLAINTAERLLDVPYPSPRVTLQRVGEVHGGFCGNNGMSYAPRLDDDPYVINGSVMSLKVDDECDDAFRTIAHEVAHSWFHHNEPADWIDEGLASAIEQQVVQAIAPGEVVYPPVTWCRNYPNISELVAAGPDRIYEDPYSGYGCHYTLGDGIFGELKNLYGDSAFNARIAYLTRRAEGETKPAHTIDNIRATLGDDPDALEIINRWYGGQPEMRKFLHLDVVQWTFPPTTDGDYLHFAGRTTEPGLVHNFVLGENPFCSQFNLYRNVVGQEWVTSLSDPLPVGWTRSEVSAIVVINDLIDPGTGEFSVTARINDRSISEIPELSLVVRSRVEPDESSTCAGSESYSQVAVSQGEIPAQLKVYKDYHWDTIEWIYPPTITGNTLRFVGKAAPQTISLEDIDGYCSQFSFYERDENGHHFLDYLNLLLPGDRFWSGPLTGEVTSYTMGEDGTFDAIVTLTSNALAGYQNPVLVVTTLAVQDESTNLCENWDVLSAVDIR